MNAFSRGMAGDAGDTHLEHGRVRSLTYSMPLAHSNMRLAMLLTEFLELDAWRVSDSGLTAIVQLT